MPTLEIIGKIAKIGVAPDQNAYQKRVVRIEEIGQYPQTFEVEFHKDNVAKVNDLQVGQLISVSVNCNGRVWLNPKTNTEIVIQSYAFWKFNENKQQPKNVQSSVQNNVQQASDKDDDLPF